MRQKKLSKLNVTSTSYLDEVDRVINLCKEFNELESTAKRTEFIKNIIPNVDDNVIIRPPFYCDIGTNIFIGKDVFIDRNCQILDEEKVIFEDSVKIGPNCTFITVDHPKKQTLRDKNVEFASPIMIKSNSWIGANCIVLPNVIIGEGAVVEAGSVVSENVDAYSLVAGNPAKCIKQM